MSFRKSLIGVGAGLLLSACGGGGGDGDGLGSSSYDNEIVVRVVFEDGAAFRNVATTLGDYSDLFVTFDVDDDDDISEGDLRLVYSKERLASTFAEFIDLQVYIGDEFEQIPDSVEGSFNGNTLEWVIDTVVLEDFMDASSVITEDTWISVEARKDGAAFVESEDFIPVANAFAALNSSGYVYDVAGDFNPLTGGSSAVDLRSVRVLFY
jgi:hypothetical protein